MDINYLLVEEIETNYIEEVVKYKKIVEENIFNRDFGYDPYYCDEIMTKIIYAEFVEDINERLKNREYKIVYEYFTLSIAQFKTYTPRNRIYDFVINFYNTYDPEMTLEIYEVRNTAYFALNAFTFYVKHFNKFKTHVEESFDDFKSGFFGKINKNVENKQVDEFLELFQQNICYDNTIYEFRIYLSEKILHLKKEIIDNVFGLDKEDRKVYLNKLKFDLEYIQKFKENKEAIIAKWLLQYDLKSVDDIYTLDSDHPLFNILISLTPSFDDIVKNNFNKEVYIVQLDFYNYYREYYLEVCLNFIIDHLKENLQVLVSNNSKTLPLKLKTNLSVPQLAYMFKMLMDLNPSIFDIKTNKELYQFIEASFITKGKEDAGPTLAKLNNLYSNVEKATANFWVEKLQKMLQEARKV